MRIEAIQIYPIKSMSAHALDSTRLQAGDILANDRIYAILEKLWQPAPAAVAPSLKTVSRWLILSRHPRLGELQSRFDAQTTLLELRKQGKAVASGYLNLPHERARMEEFLTAHMGDSIAGPLRILSRNKEENFSYKAREHCLSLINLASVRALEEKIGRVIDPSRFRANIYFQGRYPWEEFGWVGRSLRLGQQARCVVREPIVRCAAVNVDPASGAQDMSLVHALWDNFSHRNLGVYVQVAEGGRIILGEEMELLPKT